jgi:hypothetical protein
MGAELVHVPVKVTSSVVPSEYVPVAVNCWVLFTVKLKGEDCLIAIDINFTTGNVIAVLLIPDNDAVITVLPADKPVARPVVEMLAADVSELVQVTREVMSEVEPSAYVPVALNCCVDPWCKLSGCVGFTAMEANFGLDEQPVKAKVKAINNIVRQ